MEARSRSLLLALLLSVVEGACSSDAAPGSAGDASNADTTPETGFGCCAIGDTPPDCFRGYGRRKTSPTDTCGRGVWDGDIVDPTVPGWTKTTDADGCPVWKPPAGAPIFTCGGDASPDSSRDAPAEASD